MANHGRENVVMEFLIGLDLVILAIVMVAWLARSFSIRNKS